MTESQKKHDTTENTSPEHKGGDYEKCLLTPRARHYVTQAIIDQLIERHDEYDGFVICGYSMAIIGSILADRLNKDLVIVRKNYDSYHSPSNVEGWTNQKLLFIDDMIFMGETLEHVNREIKQLSSKIVGIGVWRQQVELVGKFEHIAPLWFKMCLL